MFDVGMVWYGMVWYGGRSITIDSLRYTPCAYAFMTDMPGDDGV